MAPTLTPVHGGLSAPVNRITSKLELPDGAPKIDVNETDLTTLYRVADGTLSPLNGAMGKADYDTVLSGGYIERSGSKSPGRSRSSCPSPTPRRPPPRSGTSSP